MGAHNIIKDIFSYIYGYMTRQKHPKSRRTVHHEGREEPSAAKPQPKESEYLPQRRKGREEKEIIFIRTWRSSRLGGTNIRIRDVSYVGRFTQAAKTFKHSSTKFVGWVEF